MYSIPFSLKVEDIYKAQFAKAYKEYKEHKPSAIELSKSIAKGLSMPPQEEAKRVVPDTRYYAAPVYVWGGGSGGE